MISKSVLKPNPLASQKIRRRWVFAYMISFAFVILSILLDKSSYVELEKIKNISWISWSIAMVSMLTALVAFIRLLGSDYAILARTPIYKLDERQILVHYRATELCFHIVSLVFILLVLYISLVPKIGLPLVNQNASRQLLSMTIFFITGLKIAMIAWLEPDLIEEAPAEIASA